VPRIEANWSFVQQGSVGLHALLLRHTTPKRTVAAIDLNKASAKRACCRQSVLVSRSTLTRAHSPLRDKHDITLSTISELPVDRLVGILLLMQPDQEVISVWRDSARFWEKHREIIRQMFAPVTQALVEDGLIGSRHVVLDIATGPGEPALTIAALVGPEGKVFGIDHVPEMVEAARRATDHPGFRNAQFDVASADRLPFLPDTFDAVVSRFGVMFFPSPVDAVREMLRVLKPGRKLALAVWHFAERNPFFYTLQRVVERYVDWPSPAPDAADPFRFATPGKLRDLLGEAGAMAPRERLL